jgi:DNA-binding NarL/FixJ family response regulator
MHVDEDFRRAMLAAGATTVISKGALVEELYEAIMECACVLAPLMRP